MKVIIFTLSIIAVVISICNASQVQEPEGCEFCRAGMNLLYAHINLPESIEGQIGLLQEACNSGDFFDPEGCKLGIETWWPVINPLILNEQGSGYLCYELSNFACDFPGMFNTKTRGWDCETCKADLTAVAKQMKTPNTFNVAIYLLQGPLFCESYDLDDDQLQACKDIISEFIPRAYEILFSYLESNVQKACHIIYDGICENPQNFWMQ